MQLKQKFFLIFTALAIVPVLLFSYLAYYRYTSLVDTQVTKTSENIMEQAVTKTDNTFSNLSHILEIVQFDSPNNDTIVQELHKYTLPQKSYNDYDIYETNKKLKYIFQNLTFSTENINGIFIFTPSGEVLGQGYGNGVDVLSDYDPSEDEWYKNTLSMDGQIYIDGVSPREYLLNDTPSLSFSMTINDVYTRAFLGVLYINCSPDILSLDSVNVLPEATSFYIRRNDSLLYSSTESFDMDEGKTTLLLTQELSIPGVTLSAVFDRAGLYADFHLTLRLIIAGTVFLSAIFVVLAFLLAKYLTKPISTLSSLMSRQKESRAIPESPYLERKDEIGILYNEYKQMLEENNRYIKTEFENRLIILDSQMKALEAQINAHFLYNTLEAINSLASIEGSEEISTMALALGDMFRYSIKTKGELVSLKDELTHVQNFIAIQLIRFENAFSFIMDVPDELLNCKVLKLILQPLVENALYHGLLHCNAGSHIRLSAKTEDQKLILCVTDDGVGIEAARLQRLEMSLAEQPGFQELGRREHQSIGLKNIHTRIFLYYGEDYGLSIKSSEGSGTAVTIVLPDTR